MSRTDRGLLREIGGSGVQGITRRAPCAAAARDVVGTASRCGLLLGDWWREAQGPTGRLLCGVRSVLCHVAPGSLWGARRPFVVRRKVSRVAAAPRAGVFVAGSQGGESTGTSIAKGGFNDFEVLFCLQLECFASAV